MKNTLMKSAALLIILALGAGVAIADCGVKNTAQGTLKSVDADSHTIVVAADGKEVELTLTDKTEVTDADGNKIAVADLVGKKVQVVSEHSKIDSIKQLA